jgi:polyisoprenoid-binding protein YceI
MDMQGRTHSLAIWLISFFLLGISPQIRAQATSNQLRFTIKNGGIDVDGSFTKVNTTIKYDRAEPSRSSFSAEAFVSSINTGIAMRDNHLRKPDFFDALKYPKISFVSTNVAVVSPNTLQVTGNLTIKGVTKKVVLAVKVVEKAGKMVFSTTITINRNDYGVGGSSWVMADNVLINVKTTE